MISVIIPVFNKKDTLTACLESILADSYRDKEIIVVDDNSTDGSRDVLGSFAKRGVIVIKLPRQQGVSSASNTGLARARGEIIVRTDADVVVPQNWLDSFAGHFQDPRVIAVGGATHRCLNKESIIARANSLFVAIVEKLFHRSPIFGRLSGANRAIRRTDLESVGGFSVEYPGCEDRDLFLRLKGRGSIIFDPGICVKTIFPSSWRQLWERKFSWGESEGKRAGLFFSSRFLFSAALSVFNTAILITTPIFPFFFRKISLLPPIIFLIEYAALIILGLIASLKECQDWIALSAMPFLLLFSETAYALGAAKGIGIKCSIKKAR
jgi:glycosyltransferase involved in cell wall biosynthesis